MWTHWAEDVGFFLTVVATGVALDGAPVFSHARRRVAWFIRRRYTPATAGRSIIDCFQTVNDTVFGRFFSDRFFSISYFLRSSLVSATFFLAASFIQFLVFRPDFGDSLKDSLQISIIISCIAVNLIIDWVSFRQTQIFFSIAAQQKSFGRIVFLLISDFILTINGFMAVYALFMFFWIAFLVPQPRHAHMSIKIYRHSFNAAAAKRFNDELAKITVNGEFSNPFNSSCHYLLNITVKDVAGFSNTEDINFYTDSYDLNVGDIIKLLKAVVRFDSVTENSFFTKKGKPNDDENFLGLKPKTEDKIEYKLTSEDVWKKYVINDDYDENIETDINIPKGTFFAPFYKTFHILYNNAAEFQTNFVNSLFGGVFILNIHPTVSESSSFKVISLPLQMCYQQEASADVVHNCISRAILPLDDQKSFIFLLSNANDYSSGIFFPQNTVAITSLSATIISYMLAILLFSANFIHRTLRNFARPLLPLFLLAPMASSSIVIATILLIIKRIYPG